MVKISYFTLLLVVLFALILGGCEAPTSSDRFQLNYILVGNLISGEPISAQHPIFVGQTVAIPNGNLFESFIADADVAIYNTAGELEAQLAFSVWMGDSLATPKMGYSDPQSAFMPVQGETYRIVARIANEETGQMDSVWAETTMPEDISIVMDSVFAREYQEPLPELPYENADTVHPLRILVADETPIRLHSVYYCLEEWQDARYIGDFGFEENEPVETEEDYEEPGDGSPRRVESFYEYTGKLAEDGHYYVTLDAYQHLFQFYGRYEVKIYSIDENYYRYLYKNEGYRFGGIHNGFGYFGGQSGKTFYTRVIHTD